MSAINYHSAISLGKRIKGIRTQKGLTQQEFADSLGIVQGFLSGIERDKKVPSDTLIIALCTTYGINREWLETGLGEAELTAEQRQSKQPAHASGTPLLRQIHPDFPDSIEDDDIGGYLTLPGVPDGCFAIVAQGDYMAPTVRDGDLVVFRPGGNAQNGEIVLINNKWGEAIIRRYRAMSNETLFSSDNPVYTSFKPDPHTRIFGSVEAIWRKMNF